MKIQFMYSICGNPDEYAINNALELSIAEREGGFPKAVVEYDIQDYERLKQFDTCKIIRNGVIFFKGMITSFAVSEDIVSVELSVVVESGGDQSDDQLGGNPTSADIIKKFKMENPELFVSTSSNEISKTGNAHNSCMLAPRDGLVVQPIDDKIIADSLKIRRSRNAPIGETNLEVSCSWISKRNGGITLSSQISNRFRSGRVDTLTPRKLVDSWPRFGDRIARNARPTKYFIVASRLAKKDELSLPPIPISDDIPGVTLRRHSFDSRLGIAWDYDQFMTETFTRTILNQNAPSANKKLLRINLKNVQEYVENDDCRSFFRSQSGCMILNEIQKSAEAYMALSMRNTELSCELADEECMLDIDCSSWISVDGIPYKITSVDYRIAPFERRTKIVAKGFESSTAALDNISSTIRLDNEEVTVPRIDDVIHDVVVQNDGDTQYEKLTRYISEQRHRRKITKS
ncbi:MAG: hypothetical protein LBJ42_02305, partial [Holosporales bacterium]|nr:hypothetical protein [Holosporales bacterium]